MRKILATLHKLGGISCHEQECPFKKECANHETAGEFRNEGGFSPELTIVEIIFPEKCQEVRCATRDRNPIYERYSTVPINHDALDRGEVYVGKDGKLKVYEWGERDSSYRGYFSDGDYDDWSDRQSDN